MNPELSNQDVSSVNIRLQTINKRLFKRITEHTIQSWTEDCILPR